MPPISKGIETAIDKKVLLVNDDFVMPVSQVKLSPEIVSLIHHVELNREGWWEEAIRKLILASLLVLGKPSSADEIVAFLKAEFGVDLSLSKTETQIKTLTEPEKKIVFLSQENRYKLSEDQQRKMKTEVDDSISKDQHVAIEFKKIVSKNCLGVDANLAWKSFNEKLLLPFIKEAGANTYTIVVGGQKDIDVENVERFLSAFVKESHMGLQRSIKEFLNLSNDSVRSYILRYLNAFFFVEASGIDEDNLNKINSLIKTKPSFAIFLDTNFIFGILGFRDAEANRAAESFLELINNISDRVQIKLYILSRTLDEAKSALGRIADGLGAIRLHSNLANAVVDLDFDGFINRLAIESQRAGKPISPKKFLDPYQTDLLTILRGKGIELYNASLKEYEESKEVAEDVDKAMQHQKGKTYRRPKESLQWFHDVVLWHLVKNLRPPVIESPLDAKNWIITVDYSLLKYDSMKQRGGKFYPVCLLPVSFVQMLQFWVPRNPRLEEALFTNARLPMLFPSFDPRSETAALRILDTLSRYEHVQDLPKETVATLLASSALQQKLFEEKNEDKRMEYVKEALVDEHAKVAQKLGEETRRRQLAEAEAQKNKREALENKNEAIQEKSLRDKVERDLSAQLEGIRKILGESQLQEAQKVLAADFYKKTVVVPVALGIFISVIISYITYLLGFGIVSRFGGALVFLLILMEVKKSGGANEVIVTKRWFVKFSRFYKLCFAALSLVGVVILEEIIRALLRHFFPTFFS